VQGSQSLSEVIFGVHRINSGNGFVAFDSSLLQGQKTGCWYYKASRLIKEIDRQTKTIITRKK
jgi:hypothetical protein